MTSELSSMYAVKGLRLVGSIQSPLHGAAVSGWEGFISRAHKNGVRHRCALRAKMRHRIPYRVEEHEHRSNVVSVGNREELVHATQEADRILLPEEIVQEDAHCVEADRLCPSELTVDGTWVDGRDLPHLQLVDGRTGNEVATDKPACGIGPCAGPLL